MIGRKLLGRYELIEQIGGGGMAVVFKAKDLLLNRRVAVKILRPEFSSDEDFVQRFRREAQSAASLSHPNIVNIYDVGEEESTYFIVMEYINGPTLKEYIAQHGALPIEKAVQFTIQIAEALSHAHQNNIIHRDIKPHNIIIGPDDRIKVTDFGIARAATSSTITMTGAVMGSVHYFSPEQARGGFTDVKSDIYSLGVVLYEMVTGELPFSGDSPVSVALKHLQDAFVPPRELNPAIPQSLENIILRSLAKDQDQRYHSARELIADLKTCLDPDRINEAPWQAAEDDQATKIVPVINDDLFETKVIPLVADEADEEQGASDAPAEEDQSQKRRSFLRKRSRWFRILLAALIIFLVGFGSYQGLKIYFAAQNVEVPNVQELPVEEATSMLEKLGLTVEISSERYHDEVEEGHVIRQNPVEGTKIPKGSVVRLTVSLGKPQVQMPSVINLSIDQARTILKDFVITTEEQYHDTLPDGYVISQSPAPHEKVNVDETTVHLVVSKGKQTYRMPDLSGKTLEEARDLLSQMQLGINEIKQGYSDQYEQGKIFDQWPYKPGDIVEKGEAVDVWVSEGPEIKQKTRKITVQLDEDHPHPGKGRGNKGRNEVHVEIKVKDINGERTVHDERIRKTKTYSVEVQVTPSQPAIISVYVNGEFYFDEQVHFND